MAMQSNKPAPQTQVAPSSPTQGMEIIEVQPYDIVADRDETSKALAHSPEVEALIDQTAQARQGIELEKAKVEKAKVETERVKQEALQTYERMAAVAKANGIDVQIKAEALRNPFVAQYEVAKALQNWKGEVTLPSTLAIMEQASNGGGGTSIFPIVPITTGK